MFDPIARIIAAVLAFFYSIIPNYGVAIILLTVLVMIIIAPLTIKSTRSMLAMQKLQPEMKRLQAQHKNDRAALNEAVMALYKEHGVSPLGGCLPMLLPFPVFFALFKTIDGLGHTTPKYLNKHTAMYHDIVAAGGHLKAFGMDLAQAATSHHSSVGAALPYFALVLIMVGSQYYQQAQLTRRNPAAMQGPQAAMMKFLPIVFGLLFIRFPAGVLVYYATSNLLRIFQQWAMYRYDPKVRQLAIQDVREVEAKTREIDAQEQKRPTLRGLLAAAGTQEATDRSKAQRSTPAAKPSWRSLLSPGTEAPASGPKGGGARPARPAAKGGGPGEAGKRQAPAKPVAGSKPTAKAAPPPKTAGATKAASGGAPRPKTGGAQRPSASGSAGGRADGARRATGAAKQAPTGKTERTAKPTNGAARSETAARSGDAAAEISASPPAPGTTGAEGASPTSQRVGRTGAGRNRPPAPAPDANREKRSRRGR